MFVGVRPSAVPAAERGITILAVVAQPDGARLADLLARAAAGELPARCTRSCRWTRSPTRTGR